MAKQTGKGWSADKLDDIPPTRDSFMKGWHSVRNHLNITAFGINGVTVNKGEELTKEHHEGGEAPHQEFFYVAEGRAKFILDGQELDAPAGTCLHVEPEVKRRAIAAVSPTTLLIISAPVGQAYQVPDWDKA